eukprot:jgi/Tetstr1/432064/TSEL_021535.t1
MALSTIAPPAAARLSARATPARSGSMLLQPLPLRCAALGAPLAHRTGVPARRGMATVRASAEPSTTSDVSSSKRGALFADLDESCAYVKSAPSSEKVTASSEVLRSMSDLRDAGAVPSWGAALNGSLERRNVFLGELKQMGILSPDQLGTPSVRDDAAFLIATVGSTSVLALIAGVTLPGDWGFFVPYLLGGISIGVLAIGSTAPGLLQFAINQFSQVYPDYRERCVLHEAAHFLVGYLLGVPISGYSLDVGYVHTDFVEAKLQCRLVEKKLTDEEVDVLAVLAMAGVAAEGLKYEEVTGQTGDLFDLQRILLRSENKLSDNQQQNMTRWAVFQALSLIKSNQASYDALVAAMKERKSVAECIKAIEAAA